MKYPSPRRLSHLSRRSAAGFYISFCLLLSLGITFWGHEQTAQAVGNTRADQNLVKFTARALYGGNFKFGNWLPIEITLQNDGPSTTVQVETTLASEYSSSKLSSNFQRSVSLDQRASKKIILYARPFAQNISSSRNLTYPLDVQLKSGDQLLDTQTIQLQPVDNTDYLLGMLGVTQAGSSNLNDMHVGPLHSRVTTTVLTPSELPDRVEGLASFDALIISNISTDGLSKDQQVALKSWISQGGTLLLMGGSGWSKVKSGLDSSLLPFQVYDYSNTTNVSALAQMLGDTSTESLPQPVVMARAQVLQGASPLVIGAINSQNVNENVPMLAQRIIGAGRVIASAPDLTISPLSDWSVTAQLWQNLLNYSAPAQRTASGDSSNQFRISNDYFSLVSNVPAITLPDILPFFVIFLVYIAMVGPINYIILKRVGRLSLAWATIPLSIALFTTIVVVFFVSTQPAGQALVNQMSVIQAEANADTAQMQSYVAVFSPEDKNYNVKVNLPSNASYGLFNPLLHQSSFYNQSEPTNTIAEDGKDAGLLNFHVGQWSVQAFTIESNLSGNNYNLQADLHFQNNNIVGTLRNNTAQTLSDGMLVFGEQLLRLKNIAPGETISVNMPLPSPTDVGTTFCGNGYTNYSAYTTTPITDLLTNLWSQSKGADDKELQSRIEFIKRLFQNGDYGPLNPHRDLDLMAWVDGNPASISIAGTVTQAKTQQLLVEGLPISDETTQGDGHVAIPASYLRPDIAINEHNLTPYTNRNDRLNQVCLTKGSVTFQFRLPTEQGLFKLQHLQLYINSSLSNSAHAPALPDAVEFFDWQTQSWVKQPTLVNSANSNYASNPRASQTAAVIPNEIADPARFANPQTGLILLRLDSNNQNYQIQCSLATEGMR